MDYKVCRVLVIQYSVEQLLGSSDSLQTPCLVRYLKLLVQEFNIRLDKGFLLSLADVFANMQKQEPEVSQVFYSTTAFEILIVGFGHHFQCRTGLQWSLVAGLSVDS